MNIWDILIIALIVLVLAAAVIGIIKRKKRGCDGCGCQSCNCEGCKYRK